MQDSVNGSGRTKVILILLLLATCYVADWSDDTYSFSVASCYTVFHEANPTLLKSYDGGGGGMNSSSMLTALAQLKNAGQERQTNSGLESVFGSPLGSSSSNSSQAQSARLKARELLTQPTIDRAEIERFRTEQIALADTFTKRVSQALGDAAEILTPEQRRKLDNRLPFPSGPGHHWNR